MRFPNKSGCEPFKRGSSGKRSREEVSVGSVRTSAPNSEQHSKTMLTREGDDELSRASAGRRPRHNWALHMRPRYFRENFRKQPDRMIRALMGHLRAKAGDGVAFWIRDCCRLQAE